MPSPGIVIRFREKIKFLSFRIVTVESQLDNYKGVCLFIEGNRYDCKSTSEETVDRDIVWSSMGQEMLVDTFFLRWTNPEYNRDIAIADLQIEYDDGITTTRKY